MAMDGTAVCETTSGLATRLATLTSASPVHGDVVHGNGCIAPQRDGHCHAVRGDNTASLTDDASGE